MTVASIAAAKRLDRYIVTLPLAAAEALSERQSAERDQKGELAYLVAQAKWRSPGGLHNSLFHERISARRTGRIVLAARLRRERRVRDALGAVLVADAIQAGTRTLRDYPYWR